MKKRSSSGYIEKNVITGIAVALAIAFTSYFFAGTFIKDVQITPAAVSDAVTDSPISIPTVPSALSNSNSSVSLFFGNAVAVNSDCAAVLPVRRVVQGDNAEVSALLELFKGPTPSEQSAGITSVFSDKTAGILESLSVQNGVAAVGLADITKILPAVSSSCGSQQFISSVETTLEQFGDIQKVIFAIEGSPKKFYNWVGLGCSADNNDCDASMFK